MYIGTTLYINIQIRKQNCKKLRNVVFQQTFYKQQKRIYKD